MRHEARQSAARAWGWLERIQAEDGAWRVAPEPRILENALVAIVARGHAPLAAAGRRAEAFLARARPQTHHPIAATIDRWLLEVAAGRAAALDLTDASFADPAFRHRQLFFAALALSLKCPVTGGPALPALVSRLTQQLEGRRQAQMKVWSGAEVASLLLLLCPPGSIPALGEEAVRAIEEAQTPSGSIGENPLATALAVAALARWAPQARALAAATDHLIANQHADGTWRFCDAEVWDTALLMRAFSTWPDASPRAMRQAHDFLRRAQNADGGWPYRMDVESDTDTTGMAMLAMDARHSSVALAAGHAYLNARRTEGGVWRTWHYKDDPPAEDAVAHAVMALRRVQAPAPEVAPAQAWLAAQLSPEGSWRAHWYNSKAYAANEVGMALGRQHPATRYAAHQLIAEQRSDGGWATAPDAGSTAAATGASLALLCQYLRADHPVVERAVRHLLDRQGEDGAWSGPTDMYAPRPFAVDYPLQTHALAAQGLLAFCAKQPRPTLERRRARSPRDYLSAAREEAR